jgi:hypothetical protein
MKVELAELKAGYMPPEDKDSLTAEEDGMQGR